MKRLACVLFLLGAVACDSGGDPGDDDDGGGDGSCLLCPPDECTTPPCDDVVAIVPYDVNLDLDLLFMIDNSGSMAEEQASVLNNFSRLINVLANIEGGLPNVHLGVISPDVGAGPFNITGCEGSGDNGIFQNTPRSSGCSPPSGQFISDIGNPDGTRDTNYSGDLSDAFACIARLGIDGCGFEQPLESMRRALNGSNPQNTGFLREDALLAVVIITDEDDCSTENTQMFDTSQNNIDDPLGPLSSFRCFEFGVVCNPDDPRAGGAQAECRPRDDSEFMYPVQEYVDFLKSLKDDPTKIVVSVIIGAPDPVVVGTDLNGNPELRPSCKSASGQASPGIRLESFATGFPGRHTISTICNEDLSDALVATADLLSFAIGRPCLQGPLTMPLDCTVEDVQNFDAANEVRTELVACDDHVSPSETPCFLITGDPVSCPDTETGLTVRTLPENRTVAAGTVLVVTCKVDAVP